MKRKKIVIITASMLAMLAVLFLLISPSEIDSEKKNSLPSFLKRAVWRIASVFTTTPDPAAVQPLHIRQESFIRDIILEKSVVCSGEEFIVYVEAANSNGDKGRLVYTIGTRSGNPGLLSFSEPGTHRFDIVVKDAFGEGIQYAHASVRVNACVPHTAVRMSGAPDPENQERIVFTIAGDENASRRKRYHWDFGDGTVATTLTSSTTHSYEEREQREYASTFVAQVTVIDEQGRQSIGRTTVTIPNISYLSLQMGNPVMPVRYDRFLVKKGDRYETRLVFHNVFAENVEFDEARIALRTCDGIGELPDAIESAERIIDTTAVPAYLSADAILSLPAWAIPESACFLSLTLHGNMGPEEQRVRAQINLDLPPRPLTQNATRNTRVTDRALLEKLNRAAAIRGTNRPITDEEIKRLEREGKI